MLPWGGKVGWLDLAFLPYCKARRSGPRTRTLPNVRPKSIVVTKSGQLLGSQGLCTSCKSSPSHNYSSQLDVSLWRPRRGLILGLDAAASGTFFYTPRQVLRSSAVDRPPTSGLSVGGRLRSGYLELGLCASLSGSVWELPVILDFSLPGRPASLPRWFPG